jgi:hypothetical protein
MTLMLSLSKIRYVSGVPHRAQNPRSAKLELLNIVGAPRVQRRFSDRRRANAMNGSPEAFWHMRQWQMLDSSGAVSSA